LFPDLSSYAARHSWATIAAELDIPKETIAKALGHSDNSVTDIYIRLSRVSVSLSVSCVVWCFLLSRQGAFIFDKDNEIKNNWLVA